MVSHTRLVPFIGGIDSVSQTMGITPYTFMVTKSS